MEVSQAVTFQRFENGRAELIAGAVVREGLVRLHVNGRELATLMCTPVQLDLLALGFLRSEGIITSLADVRRVVVCPSGACVEVWLRKAELDLPSLPTITSWPLI
jgi:FdhD protein